VFCTSSLAYGIISLPLQQTSSCFLYLFLHGSNCNGIFSPSPAFLFRFDTLCSVNFNFCPASSLGMLRLSRQPVDLTKEIKASPTALNSGPASTEHAIQNSRQNTSTQNVSLGAPSASLPDDRLVHLPVWKFVLIVIGVYVTVLCMALVCVSHLVNRFQN
jgi:hypothetical protein